MRPKIVVLGMMAKMPVAGVVWQTLHYLLGLERLGYDAYYVETHARTPSMLMERDTDDASTNAAEFIAKTMRQVDLGDRWAFRALHDDGRYFGMSSSELRRLYGDAAAIINLHGGTQPLAELSRTGRLVYLETDPGELQMELRTDLQTTVEFLEHHVAFFTFAENLGGHDCRLPVSERFDFRTTRQPVVLDLWDDGAGPHRDVLTTIGNWRQRWRDVVFRGETYTWSKDEEFRKVLDLPRRTGRPFELALSGFTPDDERMLQAHGWNVVRAMDFSTDADAYRRYVAGSLGEFTVAKDQNVRLRTGWFSDRSATYLAAGRPVISQQTGFSNVLPTGAGLFGFVDVEDAAAAVDAVHSEYALHSKAAREIAREYFDHRVVLGQMLADLGLAADPARRRPIRIHNAAGDEGLVLAPVARRPLRLREAAARSVLARPAPVFGDAPKDGSSVVIVSYDNLVFTRICLESVLAGGDGEQIIVVDNGSTDGSGEYLAQLAESNPRIALDLVGRNIGFAAACNRGFERADGQVLVLLNNDTIVSTGWLAGLRRHLSDPTVGMVGPVTNRIGNEAEIPASYKTMGEFHGFAAARAKAHAGRSRPMRMLAMFCVALRRDVLDAIGLIDERYEVGMLEDDDYSARVTASGYSLLCAEDVYVHHFGEASFGKLYRDGEHSRLLANNRRRFEQKWGHQWQPYDRRPDDEYELLSDRVVQTVASSTPADATVIVVSRGDEALLDIPGRRGWHFPQVADGVYAGHHPSDSEEAIRHLESMRRLGARFIVFPRTALWWLDHYLELRDHLADRYTKVVDDGDTCTMFELEERVA